MRRNGRKPSHKREAPVLKPDDPCPVHPDMDHVWGDCYNNPDNKKKRAKRDHSKSSDKGGDHKKKASKNNSYAVESKDDSDNESDATLKELDRLNLLDSDVESGECYFTQDFSISNDNVLFSHCFTTQIEQLESEFLHDFESSYSSGENTSEKESVTLNPISKYRLRPISLMTAKKIQGQKVHRPLRVLFDPGSDLTFINQKSLPKGANGKKIDTVPVTTLQ